MVERIKSQDGQLPPRHTERSGSRGSSNDIGRKLADVFIDRGRAALPRRELPDLAPDDKSGESVNCIHHWIVGPPEGDKSLGSCKNCGETRVFIEQREKYGTPKKEGPVVSQVEAPTLDK